jgi:hypothetical protein
MFKDKMRLLLAIWLLLVVLLAVAAWTLHPAAIEVTVSVDRNLSLYDDGTGRIGIAAEVQITNNSKSTVWYFGGPVYWLDQLVRGESLHSGVGASEGPPYNHSNQWHALRGGESTSFLVSPIDEDATEITVGVPFTTEWIAPRLHWLSSRSVRISPKEIKADAADYKRTEEAK